MLLSYIWSDSQIWIYLHTGVWTTCVLDCIYSWIFRCFPISRVKVKYIFKPTSFKNIFGHIVLTLYIYCSKCCVFVTGYLQKLAEFDICMFFLKSSLQFTDKCCATKCCSTYALFLYYISRHVCLYARIIQWHQKDNNLDTRWKWGILWQVIHTQ